MAGSHLSYMSFLTLMFALVLSGCVTTGGPVEVQEREYGTVKKVGDKKVIEKLQCMENSGIKLAIGKVRCKAAACRKPPKSQGGLFALLQLAGVPNFEGIGDGLKDMILSALQQTGCFRVLDRESLEEIQQELALFGGKKQADLKAADYIVSASITSINYSRKSGTLGGGRIPFLGAISTTKEKATLVMDVRLISVETGEVAFSKTYKAESGKTSYGIAGLGAGGEVGFGGALSGLSGTAMEEVARDIIVRASYDIAKFLAPDKVTVTSSTVKSKLF